MFNRKAFESAIISYLAKIAGNDKVTDIYKNKFKSMSDNELKAWVQDLVDEKICLSILVPSGDEGGLEIPKLLDVADELGIPLFEHVWITTQNGLPMLSTHKALICNMLARRLSQTVASKMIVPHNDKSVDSLTGQPTKVSTGNSLTNPEVELLSSYGLSTTAKEIHNIRGGDDGAYRAYKALILSRGSAHGADIEPFKTGVKSGKVVNTLLLCAMINPA